MYRIENNHEPIISKEVFDLVQQERKRCFEISSGKNDDRRKYTNKYGLSGKLYCEKCGNTLKRRHWNTGTKSKKIVWQCNSYIKGKKNCSAKAVDDLILKIAFIQLYNDMVVDKGSFLKVFLENAEKVISKDTVGADISKTSNEITQLEQDLSELVQLKIRKQIDDKYYNKEYAKITSELETLYLKRDELLNSKLNNTKHKEKVEYIKETIGNGSEPLTKFDDSLFVALIDKVIIKSHKHSNFVFESGIEMKVEV